MHLVEIEDTTYLTNPPSILTRAWRSSVSFFLVRYSLSMSTLLVSDMVAPVIICDTRPKPAYGRQGLDWDRWARIQFSQVHFGAKLDSTDLLWCKNVTSPTGGSNRPFRCLEEGGRALPKFLAPFQNVSKKHSGYDLLLNKYSGGYRKITIWM